MFPALVRPFCKLIFVQSFFYFLTFWFFFILYHNKYYSDFISNLNAIDAFWQCEKQQFFSFFAEFWFFYFHTCARSIWSLLIFNFLCECQKQFKPFNLLLTKLHYRYRWLKPWVWTLKWCFYHKIAFYVWSVLFWNRNLNPAHEKYKMLFLWKKRKDSFRVKIFCVEKWSKTVTTGKNCFYMKTKFPLFKWVYKTALQVGTMCIGSTKK